MPKLGYYVRGDWNAACDECGLGYKFSGLRLRWDKAWVCTSCWEPRQPQDFARAVKDGSPVAIARPRILGYSGITTTTSLLAKSTSSVNITDGTVFPDSGTTRLVLVLFDPAVPSVTETISGLYSVGGFTVSSLHRGVLGTAAQAWATGVTLSFLFLSTSGSTP